MGWGGDEAAALDLWDAGEDDNLQKMLLSGEMEPIISSTKSSNASQGTNQGGVGGA